MVRSTMSMKLWGGISGAVYKRNDFEASNIGLIEFWMMDPFNRD